MDSDIEGYYMNDKAISLYFNALDLSLGREIRPVMAILHPTNACDHRCLGCEYASILGKAQIKDICDVIDQVADLGVVSVLFTGGGEPLLHPQFSDAIKRAKHKNLYVGIFSNGSKLNGPLSSIIAEFADFIRISVDAATQSTYNTIRGVTEKRFNELQEGIKKLLSLRKGKLEIGLKFLIRKTNIDEIIPFAKFAKSLGVDSIQFKPIRQSDLDLNDDEKKGAISMIDDLKNRFPGFIRGGIRPIKPIVPCWITPLRVLVDAEKKVFLCNYFNHRRESHCIGCLDDKRLKDIWFGERHRKALKNINPRECSLFDCRFHSLNAELKELVKHRPFDFV